MKKALDSSDIGKLYSWDSEKPNCENNTMFSMLYKIEGNKVHFLSHDGYDDTVYIEFFENNNWNVYIKEVGIKVKATRLAIKMYPDGLLKDGELYILTENAKKSKIIIEEYIKENNLGE